MSVSVDVASMLRQLADQQCALGEQQAALLQMQTEIVDMQRALIEKAIGERAQVVMSTSVAVQSDNAPLDAPKVPAAVPADVATKAPLLPPTSAPGSGQAPSAEDPQQQSEDSPIGEPSRLHLVTDTDRSGRVDSVHPAGVSPALRGARYMQPPPAKLARPVTREDVDRVTRLYETGDAAHLVLQFGEHKGVTLFQGFSCIGVGYGGHSDQVSNEGSDGPRRSSGLHCLGQSIPSPGKD